MSNQVLQDLKQAFSPLCRQKYFIFISKKDKNKEQQDKNKYN